MAMGGDGRGWGSGATHSDSSRTTSSSPSSAKDRALRRTDGREGGGGVGPGDAVTTPGDAPRGCGTGGGAWAASRTPRRSPVASRRPSCPPAARSHHALPPRRRRCRRTRARGPPLRILVLARAAALPERRQRHRPERVHSNNRRKVELAVGVDALRFRRPRAARRRLAQTPLGRLARRRARRALGGLGRRRRRAAQGPRRPRLLEVGHC